MDSQAGHTPDLAPRGGRRGAGALALSLGLLVGCGGPPPPPGVCDEEDRAQVYLPGMAQAGRDGALRVELVHCAPAPPDKGDNTWTLAVTTAAGDPVDGAAITVSPFMPDHGHGATEDAVVTPTAAPGEYTVAPIELRMPGLWEIRLDIEAGALADQVTFAFCVEG